MNFEQLDHFLLSLKGKIIHQVWFGTIPNKKEARKAYQKLALYRDSWTEKNPDWIRVEWSKPLCVELVKNHYPEHSEMFGRYKYEIQRCDAIRYLILHRYGGWYVDMDYYCCRPLDEAMRDYPSQIAFVQSPNRVLGQDSDHVSNSLMYSIPGHAFWRFLMINLEKNQSLPVYYGKHLTVMLSTGPALINRVYSEYKGRFGVKSLPWKLFHPYGVSDEKMLLNVNKEVYAIHIGKGSWEDRDSKVLLFFMREWGILLFLFIVFVVAGVYRVWGRR